jgi:hypothetical protein
MPDLSPWLLLLCLRSAGYRCSGQGDVLSVGPGRLVDADLAALLLEHKAALLSLLEAERRWEATPMEPLWNAQESVRLHDVVLVTLEGQSPVAIDPDVLKSIAAHNAKLRGKHTHTRGLVDCVICQYHARLKE